MSVAKSCRAEAQIAEKEFGAMNKICSLMVAALVALIGAPDAFAQTKYNWRLTTYVPEGSQDYRDYVEVFVKNVELLTGGDVKIQAFGAGVLAPAFEAPQAVQKGIADVAL